MAKKPFPFSICEQCCPTGGADIDLSEYVKKTDYATEEKTGVVKVQNHGIKINDNHALEIECADPSNEEQNNLPLSAGDSKQIFANALKGSASGVSVFMDDVSPVEHNHKITVDSATPESVKLYACGKNMFDKARATLRIENVSTNEKEGNNYTVKGANAEKFTWLSGSFRADLPYFMKTEFATCTISLYITLLEVGENTGEVQLCAYNTKSDSLVAWQKASLVLGERTFLTVSVPISKTFNSIWLFLNSNKLLVEYGTLQIECGNTATEYEAYNGEVYSVNADGTVEGVKLLHPVTNLTTSDRNAVIHCDYNKDSNRVIEKLTNAIISLGGNI